MSFLKKSIGLFFLGLFFSCSTDAENNFLTEDVEMLDIEMSENDEIVESIPSLSDLELDFLEEYEYVTFNLAPDSFGATVNEKWSTAINLFLDGSISDEYRTAVELVLVQFNDLLSANISFQLVESKEEANLHLIFGEKEAIKAVWPDMFDAIGDVDFQGYALYNQNENFNIIAGRIWVKHDGIPLFQHELAHTIGLGHASESYCDGNLASNRSFMCSFLKDELSVFDEAIIKTLYNSEVEVGLTFSQLKPIIEQLLLTDVILVE